MSLVIDASVACKWVVEEEDSAKAHRVLESGEMLLAPELIVAEVCNAIWRKLRRGQLTSSHSAAAMKGLPDMFDELSPLRELGDRSLAIADSLDHPAYDCFYVALAELKNVRLVSADTRLLSRLAGTAWEERAIAIGDLF